jgi:hypothetical protein
MLISAIFLNEIGGSGLVRIARSDARLAMTQGKGCVVAFHRGRA